MTQFVVIVIVIALLGSAISYIISEKRKGTKCIGCPQSKQCSPASPPSKVDIGDIK